MLTHYHCFLIIYFSVVLFFTQSVPFHSSFLFIYVLFVWHDTACTVIAQPIILEVNSKYLYALFIIINQLIKKIIVQTMLGNEVTENP